MISTRRRQVPDLLITIASWPAISTGHVIPPRCIVILANYYVIQMHENRLPIAKDITNRIGTDDRYVSNETTKLVQAGFVEYAGRGINVTAKGEYFLRGIVTIANRIFGSTRLSVWNRPVKKTKRFVRKATKRIHNEKINKKNHGNTGDMGILGDGSR